MTREQYENQCETNGIETMSDSEIVRLAYAVSYYDARTAGSSAEAIALERKYVAARGRLQTLESNVAQKATETVKCNCGHTVSSALVMSTSTGSSCPDCYDRMSE